MPTATINEIAPDLFRLSVYVPDFDMQFNHFLVRDEEPLLFHAGLKVQMQQGPLANYMPYTPQTQGVLRALASLKPQTLAVMHGSSYAGQADRLLADLAGVIKDHFDQA